MMVILKGHCGLAAAINRAAAARVADTRSLPPEQAREPIGPVVALRTGSDLDASDEFTELLRWLRDHARR